MEVNPQPPPLSLAPWPRISCQSWAADTQLCSNSHTAWTQCMNVCMRVCVCISVRAHFCVWGHMKAWYLCVCMSGLVWVSFLYVLPDSICHPPPPSIQSNLRWNKNLTLEGPEATKCTQHRPQQLPTESHGHKYTDPYLPVLSTRFNGGTRG